jgi:hypothetical protein
VLLFLSAPAVWPTYLPAPGVIFLAGLPVAFLLSPPVRAYLRSLK